MIFLLHKEESLVILKWKFIIAGEKGFFYTNETDKLWEGKAKDGNELRKEFMCIKYG